ncbi:hypothetical protein HK098_000971 [Nowakowskiella sp. JEL0407]|nr:hypothetical protein HK098_000971 [Nowakowskiella sp. JEL0407]
MTSYEIITLGKVPFELNGLSDFKIFNAWYCNEHPIRPPPNSPPILLDEVWDLIERCWNHESSLRPTFPYISETLESIFIGYFSMGNDNLTESGAENALPNSRFQFEFVGFYEDYLIYNDANDVPDSTGDNAVESNNIDSAAEANGQANINQTESESLQEKRISTKSIVVRFLPHGSVHSVPLLKLLPPIPDSKRVPTWKTLRFKVIFVTVLVLAAGIGILVAALSFRRQDSPVSTTTPENVPTTTNYVRKYSGNPELITALAVIQSKPLRLFSGSTGLVEWNTTNGNIIRTFSVDNIHREYTNYIRAFAVLENSTRLFFGPPDDSIIEWDVESGRVVQTLKGHSDVVMSMALLQGSSPRLFSSSRDKTIREWSLNTTAGSTIRTYQDAGYDPTLVVLQGNPPRLFSNSIDGIREWNTSTGTIIRTFSGYDSLFSLAAISYPPRLFSAASKSILEYDANTGEIVGNYTTPTIGCSALCAMDGNPPLLFAGCLDNSVRKWDLSTGKLITKYAGHTSSVYSIAVASPYIFSGSSDGKIFQWLI